MKSKTYFPKRGRINYHVYIMHTYTMYTYITYQYLTNIVLNNNNY